MFIHNISLKHNRETTASNLVQASLLRSVVGEFHFSLCAQLYMVYWLSLSSLYYRLKIRKFWKAYLRPNDLLLWLKNLLSVSLLVISRKNCRLKLNVLPAKQTGLTTVDSLKILSLQRRSVEILRLKYLKPEGAKQKNKTKARAELFASSFRKFDSREIHADLTNHAVACESLDECAIEN